MSKIRSSAKLQPTSLCAVAGLRRGCAGPRVRYLVSSRNVGARPESVENPDDPATCPPPTGDTSATGQQGTLCTFFKYVAGGLQPANKWVSLTPAYKTKYVPVKKDDQWTSTTYFECHYFDVSTNPATGQPFWTAKSHVDLTGEAMKIDGKWLLTRVSTTAVGIPIPPAVGVPVP